MAILFVALAVLLAGVATSDSCDVTDPLVPVEKKPGVLTISPQTKPYTGGCCRVVDKDNVPEPTAVGFKGAKANAYYLFLMFDPDAPTAVFMHWVVANIKGSDLVTGSGISGDTVLAYYAPSPPSPQQHRYQLYLFEQQKGKISKTAELQNPGWTKEKLNDLLKDYSVKKPAVAVFQFSAYTDKQCGTSPNCNKC